MFSVEGPKYLRDRAVLVDELVNHILKVFLAMPPSEKFFPFPRTEESGVRDSKFFIGHGFVLPLRIKRSLRCSSQPTKSNGQTFGPIPSPGTIRAYFPK